jgi:hypothetical protein
MRQLELQAVLGQKMKRMSAGRIGVSWNAL